MVWQLEPDTSERIDSYHAERYYKSYQDRTYFNLVLVGRSQFCSED